MDIEEIKQGLVIIADATIDPEQEHVAIAEALLWVIESLQEVKRTLNIPNVATCEECGSVFEKTDGRQRFCPPDSLKESQCAQRNRYKRSKMATDALPSP